ncbi:MAG: nitroreductase family deazaflavin-dependent oxidoreductase [Aggregatilineales bacterium]
MVSEAQYRKIIAVYPSQGVRRQLFRAPLYMWRLGLSALLPPTFALLTTRGRKSGLPRRTTVESNCIEGSYYIVSAWGAQADWFKNIQAHPEVTLQVPRKGAFGGVASRCTDEATYRLVFRHFGRSPAMRPYLEQLGINFDEESFVANRGHVHMVRIVPQPTLSLPPQTADLAWIWAVAAGVLLGMRLWRRLNRVRSV